MENRNDYSLTIEQLISDKNRELFNIVNKIYPVEIHFKQKNTWTSSIEDNKTIISYCNTKYPESCFVHELLHIKLQINGFKKLKTGISSCLLNKDLIDIINHLDNHLQHHRMFPEFEKLGYSKEEFYIDSDIKTENKLKKYLSGNNFDFKLTFLHYLTVISPGGSMSKDTIFDLKEEFKTIKQGCYRELIDLIDEIFEEWRNSTDLNYEPLIKNLFGSIQGCDRTWFGYGSSEEFPNNGFFVGEPFKIKIK